MIQKIERCNDYTMYTIAILMFCTLLSFSIYLGYKSTEKSFKEIEFDCWNNTFGSIPNDNCTVVSARLVYFWNQNSYIGSIGGGSALVTFLKSGEYYTQLSPPVLNVSSYELWEHNSQQQNFSISCKSFKGNVSQECRKIQFNTESLWIGNDLPFPTENAARSNGLGLSIMFACLAFILLLLPLLVLLKCWLSKKK